MRSQDRARRQDTSAQRDALACLNAALRVRSRPVATNETNRRVSSAVGRLMEALGVALTRDAASIPASVRRAALHLARELQTSPSPPMVESPLDLRARRDTNGTAAPQDVPFTASIRLGRMG